MTSQAPTAGPGARVLMMPEGSVLAHVGRAMAVARELERIGAAVEFATSGRHASRIAEAGWKVRPVTTLPRDELVARLRRGGSAFEADDLASYVEDEIPLLEELHPDAVVGDFRPSLDISARVAGVPYVAATNVIWTAYCRFKMQPPDSWLPTRLFGKRLLNLARPLFEPVVFAHYARPFNRVRRRFGLEPKRDLRECMCSDHLTLLCDAPELFPTHNLLPNVRQTGPILWEPDLPAPDWLDKIDAERRTVYLTMGSTGPIEELKAIARRLLDMGLQVLCTTATHEPDLWPDAKGLHAVRYAPGSKLAAAADAVVCHGGNGTIYQALASGTPVVGTPQFHDQEFNMHAVEAAAVGVKVDPGRPLTDAVEAGVRHVLSDDSYRQSALRMQQALQAANGARAAAETIAESVASVAEMSCERVGGAAS